MRSACAADIQKRMCERNVDVPEDRRIEFRIGVHLGDIIFEDNDIFGDGVNIAARLEGIALPGGVSVSASVREHVGDRLDLTFEDMGEQTLKNIARPVHVFQVGWEGGPTARPEPLALPSKPSIAVLAFTNMSGDPEQEYFADGLVEDLITSLSKIRGLFVIAGIPRSRTRERWSTSARSQASSASATFWKEASAGPRTGCALPGNFVEGTDATHVWADKFEGAVEDIFDLQDRLTESIVGAIEPSIRRAEIERARRKRPDRLDAYDLYLRALPHAYANTPADSDAALRLLGEALLLDPNYAAAHAYAAWCHEQRFFRGGFHPEDRTAALETRPRRTQKRHGRSAGSQHRGVRRCDDYPRLRKRDRRARSGAGNERQFGPRSPVQLHGARLQRTP